MNFGEALPTFVITLREGVEAALVVGIVLACLKKSGQSYLSPWVFGGVGVGLIASALIGVLFGWTIQILSTSNQPFAPIMESLLEATFGVVAIAMLSWMLIWMTKQARFMKAEVEGAVSAALTQNSHAGWGVFSLVLIAVLREGFETVLFVVAKFQQGLIQPSVLWEEYFQQPDLVSCCLNGESKLISACFLNIWGFYCSLL